MDHASHTSRAILLVDMDAFYASVEQARRPGLRGLPGAVRRRVRRHLWSPLKALGLLGMLTDDGEVVALSDRGVFWLHAIEDLFSIDYVGALWGELQRDPWPEAAVLA